MILSVKQVPPVVNATDLSLVLMKWPYNLKLVCTLTLMLLKLEYLMDAQVLKHMRK